MDKFVKDITDKQKQLQLFINNDLPIIIGKKGVDLFRQNFENEGFFLEKWKEVKRRLDPRVRGARSSRKILTGNTGDLGRSLRYIPEEARVLFYSDLPYAEAHNEGTTTAGRGRSTTIPKRQFIGDSKELDNLIEQEMDKFMNNLFK